jgi:Alw26I/Eco31I/Esp3I family type II restriction endonuclease
MVLKYGGKGQVWHDEFISYMKFIVNHENYYGMPDAIVDDGKIQWEAPSNRSSGKYKDTHRKRLQWWKEKARSIGISLDKPHWISKTAKEIHPTKQKPCKRCGCLKCIRYVYPQKRFFDRIGAIIEGYQVILTPEEDILSISTKIASIGSRSTWNQYCSLFGSSFNAKEIPLDPVNFNMWLENVVIPSEWRGFLSPGAMSNAPDRFDGFHSFNICCRAKADSGRSQENLRSYSTDRRVFEYWTDGDWLSADRLMGSIRSSFRHIPCRNGHSGPCDSDHIGPISLGFCHRPQFQFLCSSCNSYKNNRMSLSDVELLRLAENSGEVVVSWYALPLWRRLSSFVNTSETALRISKAMRDNRHTYMYILYRILEKNGFAFLVSLLNLEYGDFDVEFPKIDVINSVTKTGGENRSERLTVYALEQKMRRIRVAFFALREYFQKENRNEYLVMNEMIQSEIDKVVNKLSDFENLNRQYFEIVKLAETTTTFSGVICPLVSRNALCELKSQFSPVKNDLILVFDQISVLLASLWDSDRYVRSESDDC